MRTVFCTAVALALLTFSTHSCLADGLIRRLPEDGAWARFYMTEKWEGELERTMYVTISSVGKLLTGGEHCRWIELKLESPDEKSSQTFKMLIPEKHIGLDSDPLSNAVKSWRRINNEAARKSNLKPLLARLYLFCLPAIANLKSIEKTEDVEWQDGKLDCKVMVGSSKHKTDAETAETSYRLYLHQQVPFGVAGATLNVKTNNGDSGTVDFRLTDMGKKAKTELPDSQ